MSNIDILIKGALLHDIGKVCLRADHSLGNHSQAGVNFLGKFLSAEKPGDMKQLLHCLKYHHGTALRAAKIAADDLSYLVYEADNLAAASDRRKDEDGTKGFNAQACLQNVFTIFGDKTSSPAKKYYLRGMNPKDKFNYPTENANVASSSTYSELLAVLKHNFQSCNPLQMHNNELLRILEDTMSFVPSSTNNEEVCDISLYIHSKVTAAIASCMYQYFAAEGITDYKKYCFAADNQKFRNEKAFLLISGDFSGIQNFIYTIPSKGALKSLRGRSFYLEIFMENFIDEMLEELELCRANLLYTGGGHFYVLAANTARTTQLVKNLQNKCNQWLLEKFGTQLYMAMGFAACSANDLRESGEQRNVFAAVSRELNKDKLCRYDAESLEQLFDSNSIYNKNIDGSRECSICHLSSTELVKSKISDGYVCPTCKGLFDLGQNLFKKDIFVVLDTELADSIELFGMEKKLYLTVMNKLELEKYAASIVRIYSKNEALTGAFIGTRLWLADYYTPDDFGGAVEFNKLAEQCCDKEHGIKRLGVLRADVDNLGAAFIGGFVRHGADNPERYATLSRYADLSRDLGLFFKLAVDKICEGELTGFDINDKQQAFSLFGLSKDKQRKVHVVYSGGDDMFIVGAWDELLELAVDIRRAFAKFTNGKLTFSAGLALFTPSYPISKMAELTGMLESAAKDNNKDSIALFGFDTEQKDELNKLRCKHIYHWQEFTDEVCADKLQFLMQHLGFADEQNKLKAGMSLLYRLHGLIEDADKDEDRVSIARFAYTLGRMQPGDKKNTVLQQCYEEFSQQLYKWYRSAADRKQLYTALDLLIYYRREAKED